MEVQCVLISEEEGNITEVTVDISSGSRDLYRLLKGTATFIGQWPEIFVVIMKCRESHFELIENRNVLPPPFENEKVHGPILLVRMDANAEPQDFTLSEYLESTLLRSEQQQSTLVPK
jgi:hypothetical protein